MKTDYIDVYADFLSGHAKLARPLSIVCDASNGPCGLVLHALMKKCPGLKLTIINDDVSGDFPAHGPNPLEDGATDEASKKVLEMGADFGAIFDGDGDRVVFVDDTGKKLEAYQIATLLFQKAEPPFVTDEIVYNSLPTKNIIPSPVGAFLVKERMRANNASCAAEYSGHYYFKEFFNADSGIFAFLQIARIVSESGQKMSEMEAAVPQQKIVLHNIELDGEVAKNWDGIKKTLREGYGKDTDDVAERDGITFRWNDRWVNVRMSNTEPLLRITAAAPTEKQTAEIVSAIKKQVKRK